MRQLLRTLSRGVLSLVHSFREEIAARSGNKLNTRRVPYKLNQMWARVSFRFCEKGIKGLSVGRQIEPKLRQSPGRF